MRRTTRDDHTGQVVIACVAVGAVAFARGSAATRQESLILVEGFHLGHDHGRALVLKCHSVPV